VRILSLPETARRDGLSLRQLQRLIAEGEGPPVIQLSKRRVGVDEGDNDAWLGSRRRPASASTKVA
jgi:predicted DNA-binding transcriptional regulator AlpA